MEETRRAAPPRPSVVVATVGRAGRLEAFADAVLEDPGVLELLLVVDGPDPASRAAVRTLAATRPRLRALTVPRVGQLAALDAGVWAARGDVVVLLDDDVVPDPGTLAGHAARHRTPGLVVAGPMPVGPRAGRADFGTRLYAAEYLAHVDALERREADVLDVLWTGNLSLRREDCLRVGLFNPRFGAHYHADRDLGYRLAAAGLSGVFDPSLGATHLHRRSHGEFLRDARAQGAGRVALHRAHPDRLGPFELATFTRGLPGPLRPAVALAGASDAAAPLARALLAAGGLWEAVAPGAGSPVVAAKLARRVMQVQGARAALREAAASAPRAVLSGAPA